MPSDLEAAVRNLVRDCAARDQRDREPDDLPIIVLWGARGSECSELVRSLDEIVDWSGPRAFLDGERLPTDLRPYEIANRLAFQLGRRVARFGEARFPRFFLGVWAVRHPLDPDSVAGAREARKAMIKQMLRAGSDGRKWVRESAEALAGVVGMRPPIASVLGMAVNGVVEISRTIGLLRGAGMRWYRDGLGRVFADPVDGWIEVSVREHQKDWDWVDEVGGLNRSKQLSWSGGR